MTEWHIVLTFVIFSIHFFRFKKIDKPVYLSVISFKENLVSILLIFIIDDRSIIETDYVYFYVLYIFIST